MKIRPLWKASMIRLRRFYYNIFSHFYDLIIRLHSKDESSALRDYLIKKTDIGAGARVLDICTGTGSFTIFGSCPWDHRRIEILQQMKSL